MKPMATRYYKESQARDEALVLTLTIGVAFIIGAVMGAQVAMWWLS